MTVSSGRPVLFILNSLIRGGMEQMVLALGRVLRRGGRYRPVIACLAEPGPLAEEAVADGFELHTNLLHHKYDWQVMGRMRRLFAGHVSTSKQPVRARAWRPASGGTGNLFASESANTGRQAARATLPSPRPSPEGEGERRSDQPAAVVIVNPGGDRMFWTALARGPRGCRPPLILWTQRTPLPGRRLIEPVNRLLIDRLDAIAVLGPRQTEAYAKLEHLPAGRMHEVPNGLELERIGKLATRASRAEVRAELGAQGGTGNLFASESSNTGRQAARATHGLSLSEPVVAMCVANPRPIKRVDLFCRAAADLRDHRPDLLLRFWLVGDGPGRGELATLIERLSLRPPQFVWTGMRTDASRLWSGADIGVCCSDSEGLSVSMLEAMAAGAAFVSTAVGEHPTVIQPDQTGVLIPPGNADALAGEIGRLAEDATLRTRLAAAARVRLRERYTMEHSAELFEQLVEILDHGRSEID